eukprot:CAMPEP_0114591352 /NCGR_PEP_ID=MMETSP0125-20121206/13412_1 /TAXON_ID=485358 ORGANISM="Aristerostoma sp., Strain ATCC 50986" /NCGR_SAMPLE_ID=MMETSP0125 /ASSEMBLY_ACC=CAM_ASM_000245 /LENGTH=55 /DNA_ID=CAMNT_0001789377 /DNA_START=84 /DNA_END=251 /DNA_ORIENTATION=-
MLKRKEIELRSKNSLRESEVSDDQPAIRKKSSLKAKRPKKTDSKNRDKSPSIEGP